MEVWEEVFFHVFSWVMFSSSIREFRMRLRQGSLHSYPSASWRDLASCYCGQNPPGDGGPWCIKVNLLWLFFGVFW